MKYQAWVRFLPNVIQQKLHRKDNLQNILGNTSWLLSESFLRMALGLLVGILLARYLGPKQFGTYNYALALVALLGPISGLGLNAIVTRDIVRNPQAKDEILGTAFIMRLVASFLSIVIVVSLFKLLRPNDLLITLFIFLLSTGTLFYNAFQVIDFWFQSKVLSRQVVIIKIVTLLVGSSARLALIFTRAPLIAFIIVSSAEFVLISIGLVIAYRNFDDRSLLKWRFNLLRAKTLLRQSWPLILSSFGAIIYLKIDQVMLGDMSTDTEAGIYAVAARLSEVWYFLPEAIASSIFPALLQSREKGTQTYNTMLQKLYDLCCCTAFVIALPITFIATPFITALYGETYRAAGVILSIHIWASVFVFMRSVLSKWLIAEDLFIFSLVTHGLGAIINIAINLFLIPRYGGVGAAIATVISYATASYFALFVHKKTLGTAYMMTLALVAPIRAVLKIKNLAVSK